MEFLRQLFAQFRASAQEEETEEEKPEQLLPELSVQGVADFIKSEKCKKIVYYLKSFVNSKFLKLECFN